MAARLRGEENQNATLAARVATLEQQLAAVNEEVETERAVREHEMATVKLESSTIALEAAAKVTPLSARYVFIVMKIHRSHATCASRPIGKPRAWVYECIVPRTYHSLPPKP